MNNSDINREIEDQMKKEEKKNLSAAQQRRKEQEKFYKGPNAKWVIGYNRPHVNKNEKK